MTFAPCLCSTPKLIPVMNQPVHFIITSAMNEKSHKQNQVIKSSNNNNSYCRPLKKCHHQYSKQSNASTAINRQHQFDNDTTMPSQLHIFSCLPLNLLQLTKRKRRRNRPCYV